MENDYEKLSSEIITLRQSNKLLEDELDRVKYQNKVLSRDIKGYRAYIVKLLERGFWERLFNKRYDTFLCSQ